MEELKQNKTYIKAIEDKREGIGYLSTSCITCKFKPNYMDAIPTLRSAADGFSGLGKSYPKLYKENLIMEEIFCREKLIISYEKEKSWIDASDQGIKVAKYYIIYFKNYEMAFKSLQNAIITYLQSSQSGNANILKATKAFSEIGQLFLEHEEDEWANKNYQLLYDTIFSLFPGQAKPDQPYEFLYDGLYEYFDYILSKRDYKICINKLLEVIELISPKHLMGEEANIGQNEVIQGKENDIDKILIFYYKILCICIIEENEDQFNQYYEKAINLVTDSVQQTTLDELKDMYRSAIEGNEKQFNRNIAVLKIYLRNGEMKELRGVMKKNKKFETGINENVVENKNNLKLNNLNQKEQEKEIGKEKNNFNLDENKEKNISVEMRKLSNDGIPDFENGINKNREDIYRIEDEESDPNIVKIGDNEENCNDNNWNGRDDYL
jgi:hypothetical protein